MLINIQIDTHSLLEVALASAGRVSGLEICDDLTPTVPFRPCPALIATNNYS